MSTSAPVAVCPRVTTAPWTTVLLARIAEYFEVSKPRISLMVLVTVTVGYLLACEGVWQLAPLLHACLGIATVAAGSSALNQWIEQETDARMRRTINRPLPAGRLPAAEVLLFGLTCGILGTAYLWFTVRPLTAVLTLMTMVLYAGIYTPLKRYTSLCTAIGAVPGALPPVLGWTAAGGDLDAQALALFAILFLWQFPHFLAIAWKYQDDYASAGLRMLPAVRPWPRITGLMAVGYALCLLAVSLWPTSLGMAGSAYAISAIVLGAMYLGASLRFALHETPQTARGVILVSLVYLPLLLLALTVDHFHGLDWTLQSL